MSSAVRIRAVPLGLVLLIGASMLAGCEEEVTSALPETRPFSLYGILNPTADTQAVAVYPVEPLLRPQTGTPLDAVVTSTDLETGEVRLWQDSVAADAQGQYVHIFWSDFRVAYGHRYRIEAVRSSDGAKSWAVARTPPLITIQQVDDRVKMLAVHVQGDTIRLIKSEVQYGVRKHHIVDAGSPLKYPLVHYAFDYTGREELQEGGWRLLIELDAYYEIMRAWYALDTGIRWDPPGFSGLALFSLRLYLTVGDAAWNPPGGVFDPNVLAGPGTMTNVENGFGFVGGGYHFDLFLLPSQGAVEGAGFYDFMDRPPEPN